MQKHQTIISPFLALITVALTALLFPAISHASYIDLSNSYQQLQPKLKNSQFGVPIFLDSKIKKSMQRGDVYGVIPHSFREVNEALVRPSNWCVITPLHLNIKSCTHEHVKDHCKLTFYSGRKHYKRPEETYRLVYDYHVTRQQDNYFSIRLSADKGPLGTHNYELVVEAIPLNESSSFIHFYYAYEQGLVARMAAKTYLATLGHNKVGFSIIGKDENGHAIYVDGIRGVIERNAIRYYLAIQSYLATHRLAVDQQFTSRSKTWYDLTEQYHQQLYELPRQDYLDYKQREHKNQQHLQAKIKNTCGSADSTI